MRFCTSVVPPLAQGYGGAIFAVQKLVDQSLKTWNTFFDIMFEWEPKLRQIYEKEDLDQV